MSDKIVVIMGHGNFENSIVNRRIKKELENESNIIYKDLTLLYSDFDIDVEEEQKDLQYAKKIVFQFPMHWSSAPAILKQWVDKVFSFGFAYDLDESGHFQPLGLRGKEFQMIVTMGSVEKTFEGEDNITVKESLASYSYAAKKLGMSECEPYYFYGAIGQNCNEDRLNKIALEVKEKVLKIC